MAAINRLFGIQRAKESPKFHDYSGSGSNKTPVTDSTGRCLLAGPPKCGKTALLFEYALSFATEGRRVLFISPKKYGAVPPAVQNREKPAPELLRNIQFYYPRDSTELIKLLTSLHMRTKNIN